MRIETHKSGYGVEIQGSGLRSSRQGAKDAKLAKKNYEIVRIPNFSTLLGELGGPLRAWRELRIPPPSMRQRMADINHRHSQHDEDELPGAGAGVDAAVQAGDEVGDGDVEEARGGQGDQVRQGLLHGAEGEVGGDAADHGGEA